MMLLHWVISFPTFQYNMVLFFKGQNVQEKCQGYSYTIFIHLHVHLFSNILLGHLTIDNKTMTLPQNITN